MTMILLQQCSMFCNDLQLRYKLLLSSIMTTVVLHYLIVDAVNSVDDFKTWELD